MSKIQIPPDVQHEAERKLLIAKAKILTLGGFFILVGLYFCIAYSDMSSFGGTILLMAVLGTLALYSALDVEDYYPEDILRQLQKENRERRKALQTIRDSLNEPTAENYLRKAQECMNLSKQTWSARLAQIYAEQAQAYAAMAQAAKSREGNEHLSCP